MDRVSSDRERITLLLLRLGVAFAFLYPAIAAYFDPISWFGYFPSFMRDIVPDALLLHSFGVTEIIIALWLLSGRHIFIPSLLAFLYLVAIVALNMGNFAVVFRDLSIAVMALALAVSSRNQQKPVEKSSG